MVRATWIEFNVEREQLIERVNEVLTADEVHGAAALSVHVRWMFGT